MQGELPADADIADTDAECEAVVAKLKQAAAEAASQGE
jgi:hypothetical protein